MPTVWREEGFEVMIYTRDHLPKHVHVFKAEMEAIINLETLQLRDLNRSATNNFARKALEIVAAKREELLEQWERIGPVA